MLYLSLGMVPCACDPSTQEKEAGESRVQGRSELQSKILSHKNKFYLYMILFHNLKNVILAMFIYSISIYNIYSILMTAFQHLVMAT